MMNYPWIFLQFPIIPDTYEMPPTIYKLLNSYCNFGKEFDARIKTSNLAKEGRKLFFDFDYPLSDKIKKEDFEVEILNHFMIRRIGYESVTSFKIALNAKLNEIMPNYNILFNAIDGWDLFNDGEVVTRTEERNATGESNNNSTSSTTSKGDSTNASDRRYSDTPQNDLQNVKDGKYISEYNYDTDTTSSNNTTSGTSNDKGTTSDKSNLTEKIERTPADKISLYKEFTQNKRNVYTMIFNDLEPLFYGLV